MKLASWYGQCVCLLAAAVCVSATLNCNNVDRTDLPSDTCTFDLLMKQAKPTKPDQYLCSGYSVKDDIFSAQEGQANDEGFIVRFEALADAGTAHHILVFGCEKAYRSTGYWSCGTVCEGKEQIIFAWAKNAPPLTLPKDVGRRIGRDSQINHIVIQIHYAKPLPAPDSSGIRLYTTYQRQPYLAGIYLLLAYDTVIPPDAKKVHADISCYFNWQDSIVPFGYRTHAHVLGQVISGYKVKGGEYQMIGKGNPQWPQAFYPVQEKVVINPGDILAARCTYNSEGRHRKTFIGSTGNDEMCNFYIMYYTNASSEGQGSDTCAGNHVRSVFHDIPADSDTLLPPNPDLEDVATGHHHHHTMPGENDGEAEEHHEQNNNQNIDTPVKPLDNGLGLTFKSAVGTFELGQVAGLAVSKSGQLYIFHRGSRVWDSLSFDFANNYQYRDEPVDTDPIVVVDRAGQVVRSFGKKRFYLPHGLTVDDEENVWVTDVALHQVFRFPGGGAGDPEPTLTLGMRFEPGRDKEHFCKPADVAVLSTGEFYVADGYCNNRIMKFDRNGYFLNMWGQATTTRGLDNFPLPNMFSVPHSLALAEDKNLICVADRENGRIQCFNLNGTFVRQMHPPQIGETLYAVEYCPNHGGVLFAVNGPSLRQQNAPAVQGLTFNINTGTLLSTWNIPSNGLAHPHDVTVDTEKHLVYVGELNPTKVWKFEMTQALYAANKTASVVPNKSAGVPTPAPVITDAPVDTTSPQQQKTSTQSTVGVVAPLVTQAVVVTMVTPAVVAKVIPSVLPSSPQTSVKSVPSSVRPTAPSSVDESVIKSEGIEEQPTVIKMEAEEEESFAPSLIIGMLLVVPVVILVTVTVLIRLYHTGYFRKCAGRSNRNYKFNLGNFLNSHKGFDRLSTEDDDHDLDNALDDSDNEEFSIVRKA